MDDTGERLKRCFITVFPDLSGPDIETASTATLSKWDSIAGVTLLAVIEDEFGMQLPVDRIGDFTSYELLREYLGTTAG